MKHSKLLTSTVAAAALAASMSFAPIASAEVSGSVSIANMYLWRGFDLSAGSAAVSGDLGFSTGSDAFGFHADLWGSSGDDSWGTEYDVILGVGGASGSFSYDLSVVSYVYPNGGYQGETGADTDIGEFMEAILTLGFGPVSFSYYDNIEAKDGTNGDGLEDYSYYTLSASVGSFSFLIGRHDNDVGDDPTHLDISYAYNDNLSFTVSKFVADEDLIDHDAHFVVSYSIPIE